MVVHLYDVASREGLNATTYRARDPVLLAGHSKTIPVSERANTNFLRPHVSKLRFSVRARTGPIPGNDHELHFEVQ